MSFTRSPIASSPYDALIVGARCAGAATAMLLARAGHRVLMVDRGRYGTDALSTHALMRGAIVQLHRWNVLPEVIAAGTPPIRHATFIYGEEPVPVPIKPRDGIDALYAPRRYVLDRLLVDAAVAAGVDVAYGTRITGLQRDDDGRVTGAVLEDEDGHVSRVLSRIVVGADGMRSSVARLVDARMYRTGTHATAVLYGHWPGLGVDGYEWYFMPRLSVGAVPTNAGDTCVFISVPGPAFTNFLARRKVSSETIFRELLAQAAPALASHIGHISDLHLQGFPGHVGFFRQSFGPGWALVGDAGYFKDPLTSHGITDALRDAELLAAAIDDGSDAALGEYQARRDSMSLELFEATDAIASFNWDLTSLRVLHERLARAMSQEVKELGGGIPVNTGWRTARG